jgi:hypothetical protein
LLKSRKSKIKDRLRSLLDKLKSLLRFRGRKDVAAGPDDKDPLELLDGIRTLPPREAILTAYTCLLAFFDRLGHPRLARLTPYEFLDSLPDRFDRLTSPARTLTDLYVSTAYSTGSPTSSEKEKALDNLFKFQGLIEDISGNK